MCMRMYLWLWGTVDQRLSLVYLCVQDLKQFLEQINKSDGEQMDQCLPTLTKQISSQLLFMIIERK